MHAITSSATQPQRPLTFFKMFQPCVQMEITARVSGVRRLQHHTFRLHLFYFRRQREHSVVDDDPYAVG